MPAAAAGHWEEKPIQQLIAAFAGVPIGSSWRFVQLAAAHLARPAQKSQRQMWEEIQQQHAAELDY